MVAMIDEQMDMSVKCISNFRMPERRTATDVCQVLSNVIQNRLGCRCPDYFLSDSAPTKKTAIRKYMINGNGDGYWFPCAVYFLQLAMKESISMFLGASSNQACEYDDASVEWDELNDNGVLDTIVSISTSDTFTRLTMTSRAIRASIRRSCVRNTMYL